MQWYSTEQVTKWHPDKYADQISDAIFQEYYNYDKNCHCNIETFVQNDTVLVGGNVTVKNNFVANHKAIADKVAQKLGYTINQFIDLITPQSCEIYNAVGYNDCIGAGDQGIMIGYACNKTESMLPKGQHIAIKLIQKIEDDVENNPNTILKGDGKVQVVLNEQQELKQIVVSVCHKEGVTLQQVRNYVEALIEPPLHTQLSVNPAGLWTVGGPTADSGLTGRKLVCDNYGPTIPIGGGCFSGKDFTKVDRSASYMARIIAMNVITEFKTIFDECYVHMGYEIGNPEPISLAIEVYQNGRKVDYSHSLLNWVLDRYPVAVNDIRNYLNDLNLDFEKMSEGCHFRYKY